MASSSQPVINIPSQFLVSSRQSIVLWQTKSFVDKESLSLALESFYSVSHSVIQHHTPFNPTTRTHKEQWKENNARVQHTFNQSQPRRLKSRLTLGAKPTADWLIRSRGMEAALLPWGHWYGCWGGLSAPRLRWAISPYWLWRLPDRQSLLRLASMLYAVCCMLYEQIYSSQSSKWSIHGRDRSVYSKALVVTVL